MESVQPLDLQATGSWTSFFKRLLVADFMPHGHCYYFRPEITWLHVISDVGIVIAYFSIPVMLIYFVLKRKGDVPFHWMFILFGFFILSCGTNHLVSIITIWNGVYRLEGVLKALTAIISLITAGLLFPLLPHIIALPKIHSAIDDLTKKKAELEKLNSDLNQMNISIIHREERIIELKKEINQLFLQSGKKPPYDL